MGAAPGLLDPDRCPRRPEPETLARPETIAEAVDGKKRPSLRTSMLVGPTVT